MDFLIILDPATSIISYRSPSFQLGSACVGNILWKKSQYQYNTVCNDAFYLSSTFIKCGVAFSGKFLSPYKTSYENSTGLPDLFNYLSYVNLESEVVLSENSYHTNITLGSIFF